MTEARTAFLDGGYAAVSMQQIADAAGVNKATLYHHFKDKEDLFVAVLRDEFGRARAEIAAALGEAGPLRDRLRRVALHLLAAGSSDFGRLAADLRQHVPAARLGQIFGPCAHPADVLRPAFEEAAAAGETRPIDPDLAAQLFFAMVHSRVWWSRLGGGPDLPPAAVADEIVAVLLDGVGRRSPVPRSDADTARDQGTQPLLPADA